MSVNIYENGSLKGIAGVSLAPENIFTGTKQEYDIAYADGKIKDGMIINITDDYETINPIGKDQILGTMEQITANTDEDKLAGATAVKELGEEVSQLNSDLNRKNVIVPNNGLENGLYIITLEEHAIANGQASIIVDLIDTNQTYVEFAIYNWQGTVVLFNAIIALNNGTIIVKEGRRVDINYSNQVTNVSNQVTFNVKMIARLI